MSLKVVRSELTVPQLDDVSSPQVETLSTMWPLAFFFSLPSYLHIKRPVNPLRTLRFKTPESLLMCVSCRRTAVVCGKIRFKCTQKKEIVKQCRYLATTPQIAAFKKMCLCWYGKGKVESSNSRCNGGGSWLIDLEGKAAACTRIVQACAQAMWSRVRLYALLRAVARFPTVYEPS
jgi:hypothetical protein